MLRQRSSTCTLDTVISEDYFETHQPKIYKRVMNKYKKFTQEETARGLAYGISNNKISKRECSFVVDEEIFQNSTSTNEGWNQKIDDEWVEVSDFQVILIYLVWL